MSCSWDAQLFLRTMQSPRALPKWLNGGGSNEYQDKNICCIPSLHIFHVHVMRRVRNRNSTEDTGRNTIHGKQDIPCSSRCGVYRPNGTTGAGDENMMMWYAGLLAAALLAIASVHLARKRKDAALLSSILQGSYQTQRDSSQELPEQVRAYIGVARGPSAPRTCKGAIVSQTGKIRKTPSSGWIHFTAEQTYSATRPAFAWVAHATKIPLIIRDSYDGEKA